MTAVINFKALYGAQSEDPLCFLLEVDNTKILLDAGWNEEFDESILSPVFPLIPEIDAVLISHPDLAHMGALPYLVGKAGLTAPIYTTVPVHRFSEHTLYAMITDLARDRDFDRFSLADVDAAISAFKTLKYSQRVSLMGPEDTDTGIVITPYAAGHLIGGSLWRITKEAEEIVYAVDYHHRKEAHLNAMAFNVVTQPSLLITDAFNALTPPLPRLVNRDNQIIESCLATVRGGGSVLIPSDPSGRVLEILLTLARYWKDKRLSRVYPIFWVHSMTKHTLAFAKSQLEWMSDTIGRRFDQTRENAFDITDVVQLLATSRQILDDPAIAAAPKIVIASNASLETGPAADLFPLWATNPANLVIFTERSYPGSLGRKTLDGYFAAAGKGEKLTVDFIQRTRVPLEGEELEEYRAAEAAAAAAEAERLEAEAIAAAEAEAAAAAAAGVKHVSTGASAAPAAVGSGAGSEYDVYVAHSDPSQLIPYGRPTLGSLLTGRQLYPMIPDSPVRPPLAWDAYGEAIAPVAFMDMNARKEAVIVGELDPMWLDLELKTGQDGDGEEAGAGDEADEADGLEGMDEGDEDDYESIPTKAAATPSTITVQAQVVWIDFEGRSDGPSVANVIRSIAPHKLILVHGTPSATSTLAKAVVESKILPESAVYCPAPGGEDVVEVSKEAHVFKVKLQDGLFDNLQWVRVGTYELAYVDAELDPAATLEEAQASGAAAGEGEIVPVLDGVSDANAAWAVPHPTLFVGDMRLAAFKDRCTAAGYKAEFVSGALNIENKVHVRRNPDTGALQLQGPLSSIYFKIRNLLYGQFQMLG